MNLERRCHLEPSSSTAETDWQSLLFQHTDAICPPGSHSYAPAAHHAPSQALTLCTLKSQPSWSVMVTNLFFPCTPSTRAQGIAFSRLVASFLPPNTHWIFCTGLSSGSFRFQHCDKLTDQKQLTPHMKAFCSYCIGHLKQLRVTFRKQDQIHLGTSLSIMPSTDLGLPISAISLLKFPQSKCCPI